LAEDILRGGQVATSQCPVFREPLAYFFYGRPAYRLGENEVTKGEAFCPFCFLFEPKIIEEAEAIHAFDTGAFAKRLYANVLPDEMSEGDFRLSSISAAHQLISATFGSREAYFIGDTRAFGRNKSTVRPSDFHIRAYMDLVLSPGRNEPDDRVYSIEVVFRQPVPLNGNLIGLVGQLTGLLDGLPGVIHSADDFVTNSEGMVITETTIGHFFGFDTAGIPEFVRARKAAQYSSSIDDFTRIMKEGNNGGYANTWLLADTHKNEIGRLELGLKNVTLERKSDGYFVGSNFPINEKLIREETDFDAKDMSQSATARHARWEQLMAENKGKIDVSAAEHFLADHYDTFTKKEEADERTLDGNIDLSPRGSQPWQSAYGMAGAVQNKATDAALTADMTFLAAAGHACGMDFKATEHVKAHPEFAWQKEFLRDMPARSWTKFSAR
jgi:hypothetical protein